ncbi:hypothetical protein EDD11_001655 [Mortierella claussenii]|nr:hypothetical protein EDD11_001655 [Mortierella claussenii]
MDIDELLNRDDQQPQNRQGDQVDDADELSSVSSSLSMNRDDNVDIDESNHSTVPSRVHDSSTRRSPSLMSSARKRASGADSHSDSESQFDSAMESHPNSDSESDPDLESRPSSPQLVKPGHKFDFTPATLDPYNAIRVMSLYSTRRQSHAGADPLVSMSMEREEARSRGSRYGHQDHREHMMHNHDLQGLDVLATAARQMPRQALGPDRSVSTLDDSNASESEGSLALEGIDSSRKWPSMTEEPSRPQSKLMQAAAYGISSERKANSLTHPHYDQSQRRHQHQHHQSSSSTGVTTSATGSGFPMTRPSRVKETITKDSVPRKWICKQMPVKTLGGEMMMPLWFSEGDMMLNEHVAPIELDTDRMDLDLMGSNAQPGHHYHHHHHHHHHHLMTEDSMQTHTARHKRKMKLQDLALRESRDPQDLLIDDLAGHLDHHSHSKKRHADISSKGHKSSKHSSSKDHRSGEKRVKIYKEHREGSSVGEIKIRKVKKEKPEKIRKIPRERSESRFSTRDSTPTTPADHNAMAYEGSPTRVSRPLIESNMSSPSSGPRPRPYVCEMVDCGKRFVDALQLERHIERHGPKELECDLDMCGKLFSSLMLLRRHQSMVHKRRSEKWESPPGTARQRSGRSRRREPRIVASGDVMDPDELERQPRGSAEVDASVGDYSDDEYDNGGGEEEEMMMMSPIPRLKAKEPKPPKEPKSSREPKALKRPKEPKVKQPKPPKEHKPPKGYIPKRMIPKTEHFDGSKGLDEARPLHDTQGGETEGGEAATSSTPIGPRPRPFHCTYDDCKKVFIDAVQLERHLERHGPKELECGIDGCRKRFSAQMLLRRHQSMVHKRRSPAVPVSANTGMRYQKAAPSPLSARSRSAEGFSEDSALAQLASAAASQDGEEYDELDE